MTTFYTYSVTTPSDEITVGDSTFINSTGIYWVAKYNAQNQVEWFKHNASTYPIFRNATLDQNGNLLITGSFSGTDDLGEFTITSNGNSDLFLLKFD
ncbi:MAG: hypothetical protein AAFO02_26635, partial [Bacteroidota bacterium]